MNEASDNADCARVLIFHNFNITSGTWIRWVGGYLFVSCSDIRKASVCKTVVGPDGKRGLGP